MRIPVGFAGLDDQGESPRNKLANQSGNLIGLGIECEVPCVHDMNLRFGTSRR